MDGKPLNWDYIGGLFLGISAIGRVMIRRPKLRVPKNLSSGYLKDSALPKMTDICHIGQKFITAGFMIYPDGT